MCYLQIIIIIINFVPYTLSNHFLNKHLRMRLLGKKIHSRWHHVDHSSPTFTPFFKKAFYPKRHPVQDAKFWNCIPCLSLKTLKTKPCSAAHTRQGQINSLVCLRFFTTRQKKIVRTHQSWSNLYSLHSKRFRASSSKNLGWEQKRGIKREGKGRGGKEASPPFDLPFFVILAPYLAH